MIVDKNPFYVRASEYVGLDEKFIKLFSPEILNIFDDRFKFWNTVNVFRSSPGGGKTTLLKLFTPNVLKTIKQGFEHDDHSKALFKSLTDLGVYTDGELSVAGALISFNNEYSSIEHLDLNSSAKIKVFYSLVNTRIIIAVLNALAIVNELNFPADLHMVEVNFPPTLVIPNSLREMKFGNELYNWACEQEEIIITEIDSIFSVNIDAIERVENLYALDIFDPNNVKVNGQVITSRILVMLDDLQNLSKFQRNHLSQGIQQKRPLVNTWLSERLKALSMDEIFSEGNTQGRDEEIRELENFWSGKPIAFEKFAKSVANRRLTSVSDDRNEFSTLLKETFNAPELEVIDNALKIVEDRVKNLYGKSGKYDQWIQEKEAVTGSNFDKLVSWRSLEILMNRDRNKPQMSLDFGEVDEQLDRDDLIHQEKADERTAAKLFLNKEFGIPFYYGISNISKLSSYNIEQFLFIAGELFEEVITSSIKKIVNKNQHIEISASRQEEIIKKTVNKLKWIDITYKVPNSTVVKGFLDAVGEFCEHETYKPNSWNSPGLNGIAITMKERKLLKDTVLKDPKHQYYALANTIATCLSYNLLDFKLNHRCKGRDLMLIYLNRMYCAKYHLPMNNGKFKEKTLNSLVSWVDKGHSAQTQGKLI